jgi:hypothetical protein
LARPTEILVENKSQSVWFIAARDGISTAWFPDDNGIKNLKNDTIELDQPKSKNVNMSILLELIFAYPFHQERFLILENWQNIIAFSCTNDEIVQSLWKVSNFQYIQFTGFR